MNALLILPVISAIILIIAIVIYRQAISSKENLRRYKGYLENHFKIIEMDSKLLNKTHYCKPLSYKEFTGRR